MFLLALAVYLWFKERQGKDPKCAYCNIGNMEEVAAKPLKAVDEECIKMLL